MAKTLTPPSPAWRGGQQGLDPTLTTDMPSHLHRRGYRATWPAPGSVLDVDGVVPEDVVAAGVMIVWDNVSKGLFRLEGGEWRSVSGHTDATLPADLVGGYAGAYAGGY